MKTMTRTKTTLVNEKYSELGFWQAVLFVPFSSLLTTFIGYLARPHWGNTSENISPVISMLLCILLIRFIWPNALILAGWTNSLTDILSGVTVAIVLNFTFRLSHRLGWLTGKFDPESQSVFAITCVVFLIPILEEVVHRGVILRSLSNYVSPWAAVALTSLLVAGAHISFFLAIPGQLAFSAIYLLRQKSLTASIACHIVFNALVYVELFKFPNLY
jgi:membrane protease YdiL (CAAX protease family)